MKKILLGLFGLVLSASLCFAGTVSRHTTYATNGQVSAVNLNGNFDNILATLNGDLDNTNVDTGSGFRFLEILGTLPTAGTQGRTVFLTTDNTLNFDTGSAYVKAVTASTATQGDILYYNGTAWTRLGYGTSGYLLNTKGVSANPEWAALTTTQLPTGSVVQVVNVMSGAYISCGTAMVADDSIPQNTEGDEVMTLAITPKSATNKLRIDVVVVGLTPGVNGNSQTALFQDSTANALAAALNPGYSAGTSGSGSLGTCSFTYYMTSGTTSATTFKVRVGPNAGGPFYFNSNTSSALLGGVMASSITITEIKA
jgi:hypothetical protein